MVLDTHTKDNRTHSSHKEKKRGETHIVGDVGSLPPQPDVKGGLFRAS